MERLSPLEAIVFRELKNFDDVAIRRIYTALHPHLKTTVKQQRQQQQKIGAIVSTMNFKIGYYDLKVAPGKARGTYRLYRIIEKLLVQ